MKTKIIIKNIIWGIIFLFDCVLLSFVLYLNSYFHMLYFEQLVYNFINMENLNIVTLSESIEMVGLGTFIFILGCSLPFVISYFFKSFKIEIKIKKKRIQLFPFSFKKFTVFMLVIGILLFLRQIGLFDYLVNQIGKTYLYEDYYVEYESDNVYFEKEKRNLIYIYVESFESSTFTIENGGLQDVSYTPNIERLANENINFSNTDVLGGFYNLLGANWTAAGMVAQTSGVPIYIQTKNKTGAYLDGAISLGEILEEHGYNNYIMMGSQSSFAERDHYFLEHGNYKIFDYDYAINKGLIPSDYYVWWGYEDSKLYKFAKDKLINISKQEEPFNFTILTADTHYFNGYLDSSCPKVFSNEYANSFYCMDLQLYEFINWIKEQDFYENTTIVVVGDHIAMRSDVFDGGADYVKTVFNMFLNTKEEPVKIKNREFTAFDMFPTTLASIGATIKDDRLALGTNMFSDKDTLAEEIGFEELKKALRKNSSYYREEILKKSY